MTLRNGLIQSATKTNKGDIGSGLREVPEKVENQFGIRRDLNLSGERKLKTEKKSPTSFSLKTPGRKERKKERKTKKQ